MEENQIVTLIFSLIIASLISVNIAPFIGISVSSGVLSTFMLIHMTLVILLFYILGRYSQ